jgi:NAD(P)-dependent dehydrogenase (short-subunit alcohol dehydrogenase family)
MDELRFDGQVAVVTGAGRGLGAQYAVLLASRGARVVVNDLGASVTGDGPGEDAAKATAQTINDRGGEAVADTNSVATPEGGQAIIDTALNAWGRVDILVNNAGIVGDARFGDMTADRLNPLLDVHVKGAFFVTRPAWKVMLRRQYGRIINTCSAAGILGAERMRNYGAAKTALIGLTRILAAEAAALDIKVNAIAPIAATRMLDYSMGSAAALGDPAAAAAADAVMRPFLDRLDPALVAPLVAFLAHAECPVSGEVFTAGAGHVAQFFIGRTSGYYNAALSVEDVAAHLGEIRDQTDFTVPSGPADEMAELYSAIMAG